VQPPGTTSLVTNPQLVNPPSNLTAQAPQAGKGRSGRFPHAMVSPNRRAPPPPPPPNATILSDNFEPGSTDAHRRHHVVHRLTKGRYAFRPTSDGQTGGPSACRAHHTGRLDGSVQLEGSEKSRHSTSMAPLGRP
jgi:hypothetical protein